MRATVRRSALALAVVLLAGCGSATQTAGPTTSPSSSVDAPTAGRALPVYHEGAPRPITAGTYVTGQGGFFPGLELTIPAGWSATETDAGEIALHPDERPDDALLVWKDVAAVVTNNRDNKVGQVRADVGRSARELLHWLTTTADFAILSKPAPTSAGSSVNGTALTLGVSRTANFAWDDCPDNPRCAAIFTDPSHWGENFYAIGGDEVARIFIAPLHYSEGDHTLLITLDAPNRRELQTLVADASPIIQSLQVPAQFSEN